MSETYSTLCEVDDCPTPDLCRAIGCQAIYARKSAEAEAAASGEDTREALVKRLREQGYSLMSLGTRRANVVPQAEAKIHQLASLLFEAAEELEAASRLAAPVGELGQRCNGCGHQWNGPAPVVLCGDCWRKTWPFIWGGVNVEAAPPPPAEAREDAVQAWTRIINDYINGRGTVGALMKHGSDLQNQVLTVEDEVAALRAQVQAQQDTIRRLQANYAQSWQQAKAALIAAVEQMVTADNVDSYDRFDWSIGEVVRVLQAVTPPQE